MKELKNKIKLTNTPYLRTNILTDKNGKGRPLNKIVFFDNSGEIFAINSGIIEASLQFTREDGTTYEIKQDFKNLEIFEPVKKIKVDYTTKQNFYISSKDYAENPAYNLYIYCNDAEELPKVEKLAPTTTTKMKKGETWLYNNYKITNIKGTAQHTRKATDEDIKSGRYCWESCGTILTSTEETKNEVKIQIFDKIERTKNEEKRREIQKELENIINKYISLEQALKIYEIIKANKKYIDEE